MRSMMFSSVIKIVLSPLTLNSSSINVCVDLLPQLPFLFAKQHLFSACFITTIAPLSCSNNLYNATDHFLLCQLMSFCPTPQFLARKSSDCPAQSYLNCFTLLISNYKRITKKQATHHGNSLFHGLPKFGSVQNLASPRYREIICVQKCKVRKQINFFIAFQSPMCFGPSIACKERVRRESLPTSFRSQTEKEGLFRELSD